MKYTTGNAYCQEISPAMCDLLAGRSSVHSRFQDGLAFLIDTAGNIIHNVMGDLRKGSSGIECGTDVRETSAVLYFVPDDLQR